MRMNEETFERMIEVLKSGSNKYKTKGRLSRPAGESTYMVAGNPCKLCASGLLGYYMDAEEFPNYYESITLQVDRLGAMGIPYQVADIIWRLNDSEKEFTFQQIAEVLEALRFTRVISVRNEEKENGES